MKRDGEYIFLSLNYLNNILWQPKKKKSLNFFPVSMPSAFFLYKFFSHALVSQTMTTFAGVK